MTPSSQRTIADQLDIDFGCSSNEKPTPKLRSLSKNSQETIEYLDLMLASLKQDFIVLEQRTTIALQSPTLNKEDKGLLAWGITHLSTSLSEFEHDLLRHRKALEKDAT